MRWINGKENIKLDLRSPKDIEGAQVVVQNMGDAVMHRNSF